MNIGQAIVIIGIQIITNSQLYVQCFFKEHDAQPSGEFPFTQNSLSDTYNQSMLKNAVRIDVTNRIVNIIQTVEFGTVDCTKVWSKDIVMYKFLDHDFMEFHYHGEVLTDECWSAASDLITTKCTTNSLGFATKRIDHEWIAIPAKY